MKPVKAKTVELTPRERTRIELEMLETIRRAAGLSLRFQRLGEPPRQVSKKPVLNVTK